MYKIGIDLGGTNIVSGVVDENYNIIAKARIKTNSPRPSGEIVADMIESAKQAVSKAGLTFADIDCIGVGCPGSIDPKEGVVIYSNNLDFNDVPVTRMIEEKLSKKVFIENDANAAAYGEFVAGAGKGSENFVMITLGTGVGGGVIINKKLFSGFNYAGAELGHTVIVENGEECTCGRKGCWEAYASATALIRQTKAEMERNKNSYMWKLCDGNIDKVDGLTAFDAMRKGDASGKSVVDNYISHISTGIVNMINIFQPEILCIGGGICNEGEVLTNPINEVLKRENYARDVELKAQVKTAKLGNDAGIIGAAYLCDIK